MSISPNQGPTSGGITVTITGVNLSSASAVYFGLKPATNVTNVSPTQVTAVSPTGTGQVGVRVTTPGGTSHPRPFYYLPPGQIESVSPNEVSAAGGETVTVFGTGFSAVTAVNFGTATAVPTIISDTELVFTTPAHDPGPGPVSLSLPWGTIITCGCCIGFGNPLCCFGCGVIIVGSATIAAVNPATGASAGGNNVTITGTDLTYTSQVLFDTAPADFTVISDTEVTAVAPAHIAGTVPLAVITPGGTATIDFTYISEPAI